MYMKSLILKSKNIFLTCDPMKMNQWMFIHVTIKKQLQFYFLHASILKMFFFFLVLHAIM